MIKTTLLFFLLLGFSFAKAQSDSAVAAPEEVTVDDYQTSQPSRRIYFSEKRLQPNGGGPDSVQVRNLPDSAIKKLKADRDFWYVNYPFKKQEKKEEEEDDTPFTEQPAFQTILWLVIIAGFVAFIIIYLSNSNIGLFRRSDSSIASGEEEYQETDNIFEINYQREIDKAVRNGNYRLAIRLMFLRSLKSLSDKRVIQYKHDHTNFDYLMQLHSTKYYNDFFRITREYEYAWYGQFDIDAGKFDIIKNDFEKFSHNIDNR